MYYLYAIMACMENVSNPKINYTFIIFFQNLKRTIVLIVNVGIKGEVVILNDMTAGEERRKNFENLLYTN